jgi:hypothetical protein
MEKSCEVRTHRLLQISADLHNLMAEIRALREAVRTAEATQRGQEPIQSAVVVQPISHELRV